MKVPSPTQGRIRPQLVAQSYTQGASNVGVGAQSIAQGMINLGAELKKRDDSTNRFNTLRGFSEFETTVAQRLTDLKRNSSPDGKGFLNSAGALYDELETNWLPNVPQDLQEEFRFRSQQSRQGILGDALKFQYEAGDAWFRQGISDELNKSKVILDQTPAALAAEQKRINEVIDSSDLTPAEKLELKRQAEVGLASVTYKAEVRNDPSVAGSIGVGDMSDGMNGAKSILRKEEDFRPEPYWDKTAWRIGYGSDTITLPDGSHQKVVPGMRITKEDAERDLDYRLNEREGAKAREQVGEDWNRLPANVQAALKSVAYNYGSLPASVVSAIHTGDMDQVASAVAGLSANPKRRQTEAAIIRGSQTIDSDPRYANIPYEDRVALRNDADRERTAAETEAAKQAKAQRDAQQNELYLGLLDGNRGQLDIDNARRDGILNDYDSVNKALDILKKRDENQNLAASGVAKLQSGAPFDPTDTDDKKMLNAVVKQGNGLEKIASRDQQYFSTDIVPMVSQTGDIPTDVSGTLMGMVRGSDNPSMMFALDALAQLRDVSPIAFNQRVSSDVAAQVDLWDTIKTLPTDQSELLNRVRGATTQAERQQQLVLRDEAKNILTRSEGGITRAQALVDNAVSTFGGWTWSAGIGAPLAKQALTKEFNTYFTEAYAKTGNESAASDLAAKALQREWGVTAVGGGKDLMKYPPEKVGYRAINGSYDWINDSVRVDLTLPPEQDFDLFSDEQTRQEFQQFQRDANAQPPSYRVFLKDETGTYREKYDDRGKPLRVNFKPSQETLEFEKRDFDWKNRRTVLEDTIFQYQAMQAAAAGEIPQEDTDAYNAAVEELKTMDAEAANASAAGTAIGRMGAGLPPDQSLTQAQREFLFGELAKGKTLKEVMGIDLRGNR